VWSVHPYPRLGITINERQYQEPTLELEAVEMKSAYLNTTAFPEIRLLNQAEVIV
jgi:hypothetical protein